MSNAIVELSFFKTPFFLKGFTKSFSRDLVGVTQITGFICRIDSAALNSSSFFSRTESIFFLKMNEFKSEKPFENLKRKMERLMRERKKRKKGRKE